MQLKLRGITIAAWAKAHGFPVQNVYAVLNGRASGERGLSNQIAAALGLIPAADYSVRYQHLDLIQEKVTLQEKIE